MQEHDELQLMNEIKRLEKELYRKQSQLSSLRCTRGVKDFGRDRAAWRREFDKLIKRFGELSSGGNSVQDVRRERDGLC